MKSPAWLVPQKISHFFDVLVLILVLYVLFSLYGTLEFRQFVILAVLLVIAVVILLAQRLLRARQSARLFEQLTGRVQLCLSGEVEDHNEPLNVSSYPETARGFVDQFNMLVAKSSSNAALFNDVATKLADQAHELSVIASGIEVQMQGQADKTSAVQQIIEKLQNTVSLAANVAGEASDLANRSESEGNSGKVVMTEAITGVMILSASVNEAGEIIHKLGEDSKSIGGIIDVITGVAEQTNLLALNAAIEAARAGEQGRGFAVVADEVRSLASQTQSSAQKINEIISTLLGHVDAASEVIKRSVEEADKSDDLMEGVTVSYSEIVGYMSEVSRLSNHLSQETLRGKGAAAGAAYQLGEIAESSNVTIENARVLSASSMELGKMGEQLNLLLGNTAVQQEIDDGENEDASDDVELF